MANERRLIDVSDEHIKKVLGSVPYYFGEIQKFTVMTKRFPTVDAVEVVRCKNCDHYDGHICDFFSEWPDQYSTGHTVYMEPDDFCSYGEKSGTQPQREDV